MVRGIERSRIFVDRVDHEDFLSRLDRLVPEMGFTCFAWVLMPNHVHLVVRTGRVPLSRLMARLGTGYALRFNERHDRVGHLFQNRFRSRLIDDDADLLGVVFYVLRNPLRARLVSNVGELASLPWCGYGSLLGLRRARPFEAIDETLSLLAPTHATSRTRLAERVSSLQPDRVDPWKAICAKPGEATTQPRPGQPAPAITIAELVSRAEAQLTGSPLGIRGRDPDATEARTRLVRRAVLEHGFSGAEVARSIGVARSAVSRALRRRPPPGS